MDDLEIASQVGEYVQTFVRGQIKDWAELMQGVNPNQGYGRSKEAYEAYDIAMALYDLADTHWLNCRIPENYASASELKEMLNASKAQLDLWIDELTAAWESTQKRDFHLETILMVRSAVSKARHGVVEALRQLQSLSAGLQAAKTPDNSKHLVLLIHGFNTFANWMDAVKAELRANGFAAEAVGYGYFGFARFLTFPACRNVAMDRMSSDIDLAIKKFSQENEGQLPEKISAVAHSFGSWVLMKVLADNPRLQLHRIILCGSIVKDNFDFDSLYRKQQIHRVVNHIGTKDYWPVIGESAGWGYGSIGARGLQSPIADNRWHHGFHHSTFLTPTFSREFWVPFLQDGLIKPADNPKGLPLWVKLATFIPLRWLILLLMILSVVFLAKLVPLSLTPLLSYLRHTTVVGELSPDLYFQFDQASGLYCEKTNVRDQFISYFDTLTFTLSACEGVGKSGSRSYRLAYTPEGPRPSNSLGQTRRNYALCFESDFIDRAPKVISRVEQFFSSRHAEIPCTATVETSRIVNVTYNDIHNHANLGTFVQTYNQGGSGKRAFTQLNAASAVKSDQMAVLHLSPDFDLDEREVMAAVKSFAFPGIPRN